MYKGNKIHSSENDAVLICVCQPSNHIHQDTKSARLIAVCKRSITLNKLGKRTRGCCVHALLVAATISSRVMDLGSACLSIKLMYLSAVLEDHLLFSVRSRESTSAGLEDPQGQSYGGCVLGDTPPKKRFICYSRQV